MADMAEQLAGLTAAHTAAHQDLLGLSTSLNNQVDDFAKHNRAKIAGGVNVDLINAATIMDYVDGGAGVIEIDSRLKIKKVIGLHQTMIARVAIPEGMYKLCAIVQVANAMNPWNAGDIDPLQPISMDILLHQGTSDPSKNSSGYWFIENVKITLKVDAKINSAADFGLCFLKESRPTTLVAGEYDISVKANPYSGKRLIDISTLSLIKMMEN